MTVDLLARAPVGLLPVLTFLAALLYLDSFKLVGLRFLSSAIGIGMLAAAASYPLNVALLGSSSMEFVSYTRYVSPWIEEALKAAVLVYLVRTQRVALLVDAAIVGFAIGTGFALVENLYYLATRGDAPLAVQVIRGFGTAIMHGGATAIFGIVSVALVERHPQRVAAAFLPGLLAAVAMHSAYNHLLFRPALATLAILLALPPLLYFVFQRSERSLRDWLDADLDSDMELLQLLDSDAFTESHVGAYLHSLKARFRGEVVADMLCYLRLHLELAMRAKGVLLMRESGIEAGVDAETRANLAELRYLERSIGRTGQLALRPVLRTTSRDLWQFYMLGE